MCIRDRKIIEHYAQKMKTQRAAWALREELCALRVATSEIERRARRLVREERTTKRSEGVRLTRRRDDLWTLTITAESELVAEINNHVSTVADARRVFSQGAAASTITTNVVLTLNEMVKVTHGEDVTLQLTNGAQISGADLARRALADVGLITLIHPRHRPRKPLSIAAPGYMEATPDGDGGKPCVSVARLPYAGG